MKIIVDAMGGDYAPAEMVKGALQAQKDFGVEIVLTGRQSAIENVVERERLTLPSSVTIRHCDEVVEICDDPAWACRRKRNSSMTVGLTMLHNNEGDAFLSAGSTGALLSGATLFVKRIRGIRRAAMAPLIPTAAGSAVLVDCGANIDCTPEYLLQFAYIGSIYAHRTMRIEQPRVGLLNIGAEETKGMALQREAYQLMREAKEAGRINFIGNIEAKEAIKGEVDVIVTDGFSGNVMLKTIEGAGSLMKSQMKHLFLKNTTSKLAALLVKRGIDDLKRNLDPNERGATPFLGITRPVMKAHGSSNARAIRNGVKAAIDCVNGNMEEEIARQIVHMKAGVSPS